MVYDIIRDNDSMGDVSSQVYFRFSCPGCVRARYSDTLISSILFLMVRLISFFFFQQPSIALPYLECSLITLLPLFNLISKILWN